MGMKPPDRSDGPAAARAVRRGSTPRRGSPGISTILTPFKAERGAVGFDFWSALAGHRFGFLGFFLPVLNMQMIQSGVQPAHSKNATTDSPAFNRFAACFRFRQPEACSQAPRGCSGFSVVLG